MSEPIKKILKSFHLAQIWILVLTNLSFVRVWTAQKSTRLIANKQSVIWYETIIN